VHLVEGRVEVGGVREFAPDRGGFAAGVDELIADPQRRVEVAVEQDHARALGGEFASDSGADAARTPGDEGDASVDAESHDITGEVASARYRSPSSGRT